MTPGRFWPIIWLQGPRLVESPALTVTVEERVPRSWHERLLTRPWRPWQATRAVSRTVPDPQVYRLGPACLVGHPLTLTRIRSERYRAQLRAEGRLN
jgi:hypothetical protein